MIRRLMGAGAAALLATAAAAQPPSLQPQSGAIVAPVVPPATMVTQVGPETFVVTPVPGVAAATRVKLQSFGDYDANRDGAYSPMEFAQAIYFLATTDPVAGNPKLPAWDRYTHRGAAQRMTPHDAITLLNATADEFAFTDTNNDWRVSPQELNRLAML